MESIDGYLLTEKIAQTEKSIVYKAKKSEHGKVYALKTSKDLARLEREKNCLEALCHDNIVKLHDSNLKFEQPYIVLEYLPQTLSQLMKEKGKIDSKDAAKITIDLLDALSHAHEKGILHLDIKPSNILYAERAILSDFNFSKDTANLSNSHSTVQGTQGYIAPEQFEGKVSHLTDIYQIGTLFYEMLTGKQPPIHPEKLSPIWANQLFKNATDPKPENRFQNANEMANYIKKHAKPSTEQKMESLIEENQMLRSVLIREYERRKKSEKNIIATAVTSLIIGALIASTTYHFLTN